MTTFRTVGPCCRCHKLARAVMHTDRGLIVLHWQKNTPPCPIRPGEMPEHRTEGGSQ